MKERLSFHSKEFRAIACTRPTLLSTISSNALDREYQPAQVKIMSSLRIIRGNNQGTDVTIGDEKPLVMGRNPDCGIVIPLNSVSREHARIIRLEGRYFIEDLKSRNGTFVNNQAINERTALKHNDRIRICDFIATFIDPEVVSATKDEDEDSDSSTTTVEATMLHNSSLLLQQQPKEKLRGLLDISSNLCKTLELGSLWPKIVESLFQLFLQADRCFIILSEDPKDNEEHPRLLPKFVRARREHEEASARFSRGIVRDCLGTSQSFLSDDAAQDNRFQLNQSVIDFRIRSVMCVPLCDAQGKAFGVIQLDTQDRSKKFTKEDLDLLLGVANQAAIALENARLLDDARRQERVKRDLELARRVQLSFLPWTLPTAEGYKLAEHYEAAMSVGGDYYDFLSVRDDRLVMVLGDVAGKGVAGALLAAKLSSDARFSFVTRDDPAEAITLLNEMLEKHCSQLDKFVTLTAVVLNPKTHELIMVNGGHMSPLQYHHATNTFEGVVPRKVAGPPLGIMAGMPFESCTGKLEPGDSILLYSDGVTEPMNAANEEFGDQGILDSLKDLKTGDPELQIKTIVQNLTRHTAGQPQHDDITLTCLCRMV